MEAMSTTASLYWEGQDIYLRTHSGVRVLFGFEEVVVPLRTLRGTFLNPRISREDVTRRRLSGWEGTAMMRDSPGQSLVRLHGPLLNWNWGLFFNFELEMVTLPPDIRGPEVILAF